MTVTAPRPRYHLTPPDHWLSDPNGLVWHDGYWHAYYQHNPHGEEWGHMSWGHARSRDLVEWQHSPVAIADNSAWFIFSGCALVDPDNRAGFGPGAVIAAYTAAAIDGSRQWQNLAISRDGGKSFVDDDRNPLLDLGLKEFRDPNILWHQPSSQWIMVVAFSAEHRAALYGSTDLRQWRHLSDVGPWDVQGEVWECPMLIELPIEGSDDTRWLFKVDALHGAAGSGSLALGGLFDGRSFHPDGGWQMVDGGRDFYAAVPWHEPRDADGRPCWIGWTGNHGYQSTLPRRSWRGAMSSPRRLSWRRGGNGFKLIQQVEPALAARRAEPRMTGDRRRQRRDMIVDRAKDASPQLGDARVMVEQERAYGLGAAAHRLVDLRRHRDVERADCPGQRGQPGGVITKIVAGDGDVGPVKPIGAMVTEQAPGERLVRPEHPPGRASEMARRDRLDRFGLAQPQRVANPTQIDPGIAQRCPRAEQFGIA